MNDPRMNLPSASGFYRDAECHGNRNLIRAVSELEPIVDTPTEYSERGTRIHAARETGNTFNLESDELASYKSGLKLEKGFISDWKDEIGIDSAIEGPRELRLWINHPQNLAPMMSGQLDVHFLSSDGKHAAIADWKTGMASGCGSANKNWQLRIQAVLTWLEYPSLEHIRAGFIKPDSFGSGVDYCDFTLFDLENILRHIYYILWQTQQPDARLRAGEWCKYCPAKNRCPEAIAMSRLPALMPQNMEIAPKRAKVLVADIPIEAVREAWGKRTAVKNIVEAMADRLRALPPEEKYRLGLKMNLGRKGDFIKDVKGAFDALIAGGFTEEQLWSCLSFSKTDLVELIERVKMCRGGEADAFYESQLDEFIERSRGDEILAEA